MPRDAEAEIRTMDMEYPMLERKSEKAAAWATTMFERHPHLDGFQVTIGGSFIVNLEVTLVFSRPKEQ